MWTTTSFNSQVLYPLSRAAADCIDISWGLSDRRPRPPNNIRDSTSIIARCDGGIFWTQDTCHNTSSIYIDDD